MAESGKTTAAPSAGQVDASTKRKFFDDEEKMLKSLDILTAVDYFLNVAFGILAVVTGEHMYFVCLFLWVVAGFILSVLHGYLMIGAKNLVLFFLAGALLSLFFEAMGCNYGWFFSKYVYTDWIPGPKIFGFNVVSMIAYGLGVYLVFSMGQAAVGMFDNKFKKGDVILIPIICSMLITTVDFATDPLLSTISNTHFWEQDGVYYGIPWQNYLGWYLMGFVIFLVATLIVWNDARKGKLPKTPAIAKKKRYWVHTPLLYGSLYIQFPFYTLIQNVYEVTVQSTGQVYLTSQIYWGVAIIMIGAMVTPAVITLVRILRDDNLE